MGVRGGGPSRVPARGRGAAPARGEGREVAPPAAVRTDVEDVTAVIDLVLVLALSRGDHGPYAAGVLGPEVTHLGGRVARRVQEEVREAPRARDAEPEQLVGLLVEEIVC